MIYADIKGKTGVPEDVLTSNCMGLLSLLHDNSLIDFLAKSVNLKGEHINLSEYNKIEKIEFWPWLHRGGEPDILCILKKENSVECITLIIEVKHGAGKSGYAENDQLAKYWRASKMIYKNVAIIYLTHHSHIPKQDITDSIKESENKALIYWVSWFHLYEHIVTLINNPKNQLTESKILKKLKFYLEEKGYRRFQGLNIPFICNEISYHRVYYVPVNIVIYDIYERLYDKKAIVTTKLSFYSHKYDFCTKYQPDIDRFYTGKKGELL